MTRKPEETNSLPWTWLDLIAVLMLGLGVILAIARFWQPGIASEADMLMGIYRVYELDMAWRQWLLYPRLGENLNFTYTAPLFQFYPPLVSYGALAWRWLGLGWIEAAKAMFTVGLVLAGLGAYTYARWLFRDRRAGFVAGAAYLFAPYLFINIYERGAAAESLALGLMPWLFWTLHRALEAPTFNRIALGAVLVGLLMLAHNITALFVLPAALFYLLLLAWREQQLRHLVAVAAAVGLGLGLSAFYWLPAIAEIGYTKAEASMLGGPLAAAQNLSSLADLVQGSLAVDYWGATRFHLALWQAAVLVLSMIVIPFQTVRIRSTLAVLAGLALVALAMQLAITRAFWETLPLVRFIQFPWRLLGLVSFCTAMLTASIFLLRPLRGIWGTIAATVLLLLIVLAGLARLTPDLSPIWSEIRNEQINQFDMFERGRAGFALFTDYTPTQLQISSSDLSQPRPPDTPPSDPLPGKPEVQVLSEGPTHLRVEVQSNSSLPLRLHRIYFPGWHAFVDGERVPVGPSGSLGLVTAQIPSGVHEVEFRFGNTPIRRVAQAISLVSLAVLTWIVIRSRQRKAIGVVFGSALIVVVLLLWLHQGSGERARQPVNYAAVFEGDVSLLGYHLPTTSWKPGDTIPLRLYWLAEKSPAADYSVFLHLAMVDDSGKVAQHDSQPIFGYGPMTRWEPGEIVVDQQQVQLDKMVPPGRYRLLIGLYQPDTMQNLTVLDAREVLPGDRVVLVEIDVTAE